MRLVLFILVLLNPELAADYKHHHPDVLPTNPTTWNSCCNGEDCFQAARIARRRTEKTSIVAIDNFSPFQTADYKIMPSQNGKSYFCTRSAELPPTADNILCVFIAEDRSVKRRKIENVHHP